MPMRKARSKTVDSLFAGQRTECVREIGSDVCAPAASDVSASGTAGGAFFAAVPQPAISMSMQRKAATVDLFRQASCPSRVDTFGNESCVKTLVLLVARRVARTPQLESAECV